MAHSTAIPTTRNKTAVPSAVYQAPQEIPIRMTENSSLSTNQSITLTEPQLAKLQQELSVVEGNMSVLSEMLAEMKPGHEKSADLELLRELYATCRAMQQRLVELVDRVTNDEITAHLLKINDDLNNLFLRYIN